MTLKPWAWAGLGICGAGVGALIGFAFVDLGRADQVASVAGGAVGIVGFVLAAIAQFGGSSSAAAPSISTQDVQASGERAIAAGGSIGFASTGGVATPVSSSPLLPPTAGQRSTGNVTASGPGSIAAGGDIGSASTGN